MLKCTSKYPFTEVIRKRMFINSLSKSYNLYLSLLFLFQHVDVKNLCLRLITFNLEDTAFEVLQSVFVALGLTCEKHNTQCNFFLQHCINMEMVREGLKVHFCLTFNKISQDDFFFLSWVDFKRCVQINKLSSIVV